MRLNLTDYYSATSTSDMLKNVLSMIGAFCFLVSLFQVSLFTSGEDIRGYWVFVVGWFGLVFFQFSWFANPLNLLSLLLLKRQPTVAVVLSLLAFFVASQAFLFYEIPIGLPQKKIYIKELGAGFYLWYFAQGLFLLASLSNLQSKHKL